MDFRVNPVLKKFLICSSCYEGEVDFSTSNCIRNNITAHVVAFFKVVFVVHLVTETIYIYVCVHVNTYMHIYEFVLLDDIECIFTLCKSLNRSILLNASRCSDVGPMELPGYQIPCVC